MSLTARRASRSWLRRSSWLSISSRRSTGNASSSRDRTLTSIALSTFIWDLSGSGRPSTSLSKVCSVHTDRACWRLLEVRLARSLRSLRLPECRVLRFGLRLRLLVVDHVLGGLHDDVALGVEARPPGTARDLQELAGLQHPLALAVELRQAAEQDGADRHVDADAEGVGAADHGEQPGLRQLLDEAAVARQHPGVVHPDPPPQQLGQRRAEAGGEPDLGQPLRDRVLRLAPGVVDGLVDQAGGVLDRRGLGEVDDVDGSLARSSPAPRASPPAASATRRRSAAPAVRRRRRPPSPARCAGSGRRPARSRRRAWPTSAGAGPGAARSAAPATPSRGPARRRSGTRP